MGYFFSIRDANIVAYLTCRGNGGKQVPRIASHELFNFLGSLYDEHISATPPEKTLISSDSGWIASVKQAAAEASRYLTNAKVSDDGFFEELIVERASVDLRRLLSDYNLFALIAGSPHTDPELDAFVRYAAFSSGHRAALFLVPLLGAESGLGFLDPFPSSRCLPSSHRTGQEYSSGPATAKASLSP